MRKLQHPATCVVFPAGRLCLQLPVQIQSSRVTQAGMRMLRVALPKRNKLNSNVVSDVFKLRTLFLVVARQERYEVKARPNGSTVSKTLN
jgi:hypothetical protein